MKNKNVEAKNKPAGNENLLKRVKYSPIKRNINADKYFNQYGYEKHLKKNHVKNKKSQIKNTLNISRLLIPFSAIKDDMLSKTTEKIKNPKK
jgi:hypothetical protein